MSRTLTLGLLVLALLCLSCLWCHAPRLEADIRTRVAGELNHLGATSMAGATTVDGCIVTLRGEVMSPAAHDNAVMQVSNLDGVCRVVDETAVAESAGKVITGNPSTSTLADAGGTTDTAGGVEGAAGEGGAALSEDTDAPPIALRIAHEQGRVTLRGTVPDASTRQALIASATAAFPGAEIDDSGLTIATQLEDASPDARGLLQVLARRGRGVEVGLARDRAEVEGSILSELARRRLLGAIGTALPGLRIVDRLTVRAPSSDTETLQASLDQALAGKRIEFASGSDQLTARGQAVLDELATAIGTLTARLEIAGHTDAQGDEAFNQSLSERRAETVRRYLGERGLDTEQMTAIGFGESRPIATNETAEGRQQNRRTELRALAQEKE